MTIDKIEDKMEDDDEYMCDNQSISNLAKKYVKPPYKLQKFLMSICPPFISY